jgi:hypothetical protein
MPQLEPDFTVGQATQEASIMVSMAEATGAAAGTEAMDAEAGAGALLALPP